MYAFALKGRWLALLIAALVVASTCVGLGLWQLDRLEGRRAHNALVAERLEEPPVPLHRVLSEAPDPDAVAFRRVTTGGRYDPEHEVILRGRSHNGRPGDHLLTPLLTDEGAAIVVDRGWIPGAPGAEPPVAEGLPPQGEVEVSGILLPPEEGPRLVAAADTFPGHVARVQADELAAMLPYEAHSVYLLLQEQDPPQRNGRPEPATLPELDEGPHLSYAVQWFLFASIALVTYGALVRKEAHKDDQPKRRLSSAA